VVVDAGTSEREEGFKLLGDVHLPLCLVAEGRVGISWRGMECTRNEDGVYSCLPDLGT